jgi:hypothetical protein
MKTKDEILKNPNTRLWDDEETIDLCVEKDVPFIEIVYTQNCLCCDKSLMIGNESLYKYFNEMVNGLTVTCQECKQKHFIRKYFEH